MASGWNIEDEPKSPTTKQRRLIHIGAWELANNPDLARLLSRDEAAKLVEIFLSLKQRTESKGSEV